MTAGRTRGWSPGRMTAASTAARPRRPRRSPIRTRARQALLRARVDRPGVAGARSRPLERAVAGGTTITIGRGRPPRPRRCTWRTIGRPSRRREQLAAAEPRSRRRPPARRAPTFIAAAHRPRPGLAARASSPQRPCPLPARPLRDDLGHDRERRLGRAAARRGRARSGPRRRSRSARRHPGLEQPRPPVGLGLARPHRPDVAAAAAQRLDDRRLVELHVVGQHRDRVGRPEPDLVRDLVRPADHEPVDVREARLGRERRARRRSTTVS